MKSTNGRYAATHRVLVIDNKSIMGAGVEALLSGSHQFQVVGTTPQDENDLVHRIWQYLPDVIILSHHSGLIEPSRLLDLLKDYHSFRLIVVWEDNNTMEVYEKRQITAREQSDLTTAVRWN
jgi:DNA-binding NarL/FixJ family response regulator